MKMLETAANLRNQTPTIFSATNPLYSSGGEVADDARRCILFAVL
jgi:hypothetical protein